MTVLEGIQKSTQFLARKGVESPRLQAELLLAHLLKLPRMQLYLNFERELQASEAEHFRGLIVRRGQREPLQHIVGSVSFYGLELTVDRRALIPRPETELLVERGLQFLKTRAKSESEPTTVLDFGTGSGCVAISLAWAQPDLRIYALDVSSEALALARMNAQRHGTHEIIHFIQGDGLSALPTMFKVDLLIGNPPYIAQAEIGGLEPEVKDYDPVQALDGGLDGLDFYRQLATGAGELLQPGGRIMLEFGDGQAATIRGLFENQNWIVEEIVQDYNKRPRVLIAHLK